MTDDLPQRLTEAERLRQLEQKVDGLSVGGGASDSTQVEDDNGILRYEAGLLSDGSYGVQLYDSGGSPISSTGGPSGPVQASDVSFIPTGTISSTDLQAAVTEVAVEAGTSGPPDAADVTYTAAGTLTATDVEGAVNQLDALKAPLAHIHNPSVEVMWQDNDWSRFGAPVLISYDTGVTFNQVIVSDGSSPSTSSWPGASARPANSEVRRGRIDRSGVATTGGNTRQLFLLDETDEFVDAEIQVHFHEHSQPGQMGLVMRESIATSGTYAGRPMAYVVWFDVLFTLDAWVNTAVWSTSGSGTTTNLVQVAGAATGELDGLNYTVGASQYSRSGTNLNLSIPGYHRIKVGDSVDLYGSSIDANNMTVTALFGPNLVVATHPVSGTSSGGACTVRCRRRTMPSFLKVRIKGNTVWGKAWREGIGGTGEPDWGDPRHSWRWVDAGNTGPTAPGRFGLFAGHILGGGFCEFGSVKVTAL